MSHLREPSAAEKRSLLTCLNVGQACALVFGLSILSTQAQAASTTGESANQPQLAEVVVTAEKRESTVQRTPISITAISGAQLAAAGISTIETVAEETPGVAIRSSGPGQTEYELRGLSSAAGAAPTTGIYFGETPLTPPTNATNGKVAIDPDLFDLNRIEVLRGPQGTLYGASSMGGTIRLIPNSPELNSTSSAVAPSVSYTDSSDGPNAGASAFLNLPLVKDVAAIRIVATDKWTQGWINRVVLGPQGFPLGTNPCSPFYTCTRGNVGSITPQAVHKDVNWERLTGARISLLLKPTDRLSIEPTLLYQRIAQGDYDLVDVPPATEAHYQPYDIAEPFSDEFTLISNAIHYDFGGFQFISATGYWHRSERQIQDESEDIQNAFNVPAIAPAAGGLGPLSLTGLDATHEFSQELRVVSTGNGPFQWIAGLFYSDFSSEDVIFPQTPDLIAAGFATNNYFTLNIDETNKQKAAFADLSYRMTDAWRAETGLRWYSYNDYFPTQESGVISPTGTNAVSSSYASSSNSGVSPRFNLSYMPNENVTLYGTVSKGFRPGSGNLPVPVTGPGSCLSSLQAIGQTGAPMTYKPDTVWNYELGEKVRPDDGRFVVNGDVYYLRWNNVQQIIPLSCGYFYFDNAGEAAVKGSELELTWMPLSGLALSENLGISYARFVGAVPEAGIVNGARLQGVPDWTSSSTVSYLMPVTDDLSLDFRYSNDYTAHRIDVTYSTNYLPSYSIMNARIGLTESKWQVYLFATNLVNKFSIISNNTSFGTNLPDLNRAAVTQPRTIGLDALYRF
jgi:iron complex outermembrane recepter protein